MCETYWDKNLERDFGYDTIVLGLFLPTYLNEIIQVIGIRQLRNQHSFGSQVLDDFVRIYNCKETIFSGLFPLRSNCNKNSGVQRGVQGFFAVSDSLIWQNQLRNGCNSPNFFVEFAIVNACSRKILRNFKEKKMSIFHNTVVLLSVCFIIVAVNCSDLLSLFCRCY